MLLMKRSERALQIIGTCKFDGVPYPRANVNFSVVLKVEKVVEAQAIQQWIIGTGCSSVHRSIEVGGSLE